MVDESDIPWTEDSIPGNMTRRAAIKGAGSIVGFCGMSSVLGTAQGRPVKDPSGEETLSEDEYIWKKSDATVVSTDRLGSHGATRPYKHKCVLSSSIMYSGVDKNTEGEYIHYFDSGSTCMIYRKNQANRNKPGYKPTPAIGLTDVWITNNSPQTSTLFADKGDNDVGAYPSPTQDTYSPESDVGGAAFTTISTAMGTLISNVAPRLSPYYTVGLTALQVADALVPEAEYKESPNSKRFTWNYDLGNEQSFAANFTRFHIINDGTYASEVNFDIDFSAGTKPGLNPRLSFSVQEDAREDSA